jgi:hypothetical protein
MTANNKYYGMDAVKSAFDNTGLMSEIAALKARVERLEADVEWGVAKLGAEIAKGQQRYAENKRLAIRNQELRFALEAVSASAMEAVEGSAND